MKLTRRKFLIGSGVAGVGLAIGFSLKGKPPVPGTIEGSFQPNSWLQLLPNGDVIFQLDKAEMGQGVSTALTMVMAEELDFEPAQIKIEMAGVHPDFVNPMMSSQLTGGSTSIVTSYDVLREAGALARKHLIHAAAKQWNTDADTLSTEPGFVLDGRGKKIAYKDLVETAKTLSVSSSVELKDEKDFRWLGKSSKRLDTAQKVYTQAEFGVDVNKPGMKVAVVIRCPHFGGSLKSFDASGVKNASGVVLVKSIHSGLAIIADTYWQARQAANTLNQANALVWNKGPLFDQGINNEVIEDKHREILNQEGQDDKDQPFHAAEEGDAFAAVAEQKLQDSTKVIEAEYYLPYWHHSPMEPQNASALYTPNSSLEKGGLEIWAPTQSVQIAQAVAAYFTGLKHEDISVKPTFLGGAFGRRGMSDFVGEAAAIAMLVPNVPVKMMFSREDDMQHDYYRPQSLHKVSGAIDENGNIAAWQHTLVSNSIIQGFGTELMSAVLPTWVKPQIARNIGKAIGDGLADWDLSMIEGANPFYEAPNKSVAMYAYDPGVPTGFWRSVGHSYTGFVVETLMDELAHLAQQDPLEYRLNHMKSEDSARLKATLELVKEKAQWANKKAGVFKGVASHKSFDSYVSQIVEVSENNGQVSIDKVYCAVDVGFALNPEIVKDQIMGGVVYGLTAAIKAGVKIEEGRVIGSNFHDMPVMRMNECPDVEVFLIDSLAHPTGVGEIGVPPIAAALGNAIFAMTGERQRRLPFTMQLDKQSSTVS